MKARTGKKPSRLSSDVAAFHRACGLPGQRLPSITEVSDAQLELRHSMLCEEVEELGAATDARNLVAMADALADIVYVAFGTAYTLGIDLDEVLREVHRANMTKLTPDGTPLFHPNGKVAKSQHYLPPRIQQVLERQSLSGQALAGGNTPER